MEGLLHDSFQEDIEENRNDKVLQSDADSCLKEISQWTFQKNCAAEVLVEGLDDMSLPRRCSF